MFCAWFGSSVLFVVVLEYTETLSGKGLRQPNTKYEEQSTKNQTMFKHRFLFILIAVVIAGVASLPYLMSASCATRPQTPAEQKALDTLRNMTRNDVLPSEDVVAGIENQFPRTKAAALARILRARIKLNARDFNGAAALLDSRVIGDHTSIADHALFMRADALELAGKTAEARAVFSS